MPSPRAMAGFGRSHSMIASNTQSQSTVASSSLSPANAAPPPAFHWLTSLTQIFPTPFSPALPQFVGGGSSGASTGVGGGTNTAGSTTGGGGGGGHLLLRKSHLQGNTSRVASSQSAPMMPSGGGGGGAVVVTPHVTQLQQMSLLMAACASLPLCHLLVAHDIVALGPLELMGAVPAGIPAVEYVIRDNTTRDDLSVFLLHADTNHAVADNFPVGGVQGVPGHTRERSSTMTASFRPPGHLRHASSASSGGDDQQTTGIPAKSRVASSGSMSATYSGAGAAAMAGVSMGAGDPYAPPQGAPTPGPKLVWLHNLSRASQGVIDALMDLMTYQLLTVNGVVRRAPGLRIVAFCPASDLGAVPTHVRAAFLLSTYLSPNVTQAMVAFETQGFQQMVPWNRLAEQRRWVSECSAAVSPITGLSRMQRQGANVSSGTGVGGMDSQGNSVAAVGPPLVYGFSSSGWSQRARELLSTAPASSSMPSTQGTPPHQRVYVPPAIERYLRHHLGIVRGSFTVHGGGGAAAIGILGLCDAMLDVLRVLVYLCQPISEDLRVRRPFVDAADVLCLIAPFTAHRLQLLRHEWAPLLFGTAFPHQRQPSTSTNPTALMMLQMMSVGVGGGGLGPGGVLVPYASRWDAVTSMVECEARRTVTQRLRGDDGRRGGHSSLDATQGTTAEVANSSMMLPFGASSPNVLEWSVGAGGGGNGAMLDATVRRVNVIESLFSPEERDSAPWLSYDWCRHVLMAMIRERSQPPPG